MNNDYYYYNIAHRGNGFKHVNSIHLKYTVFFFLFGKLHSDKGPWDRYNINPKIFLVRCIVIICLMIPLIVGEPL